MQPVREMIKEIPWALKNTMSSSNSLLKDEGIEDPAKVLSITKEKFFTIGYGENLTRPQLILGSLTLPSSTSYTTTIRLLKNNNYTINQKLTGFYHNLL